EFHPDVILSYWAHPDGAVALRAARQANIPAAVIVGGSDVLLLTKNRARRRKIEHVLHNIDAVITVSDHLRRHVIDMGIAASKVHTWRQGVDQRIFHPGSKAEARQRLEKGDKYIFPDAKILLWVGRMVEVKGL